MRVTSGGTVYFTFVAVVFFLCWASYRARLPGLAFLFANYLADLNGRSVPLRTRKPADLPRLGLVLPDLEAGPITRVQEIVKQLEASAGLSRVDGGRLLPHRDGAVEESAHRRLPGRKSAGYARLSISRAQL